MTTQSMQPLTPALSSGSAPGSGPRTLLAKLVSALIRRDVQDALAVLATAGKRRAIPRRILFRKTR